MLFQVEGTFRELVNRSRQLTKKKIAALAFAPNHSGIAASLFRARRFTAQRKFIFI